MTTFPIDRLLPRLCRELQPGSIALLQAPPGAGKTTRVPLALIGALGPMGSTPAIQGRVLMVEPRRLAVRAAAGRLAETLGEEVGQRIGFSIRGEKRRSTTTQVEVLTDGLFLRRLQADPSLPGVDCVLFDEFHERRRDADLAIAMLREALPLLRPDLALLLMSATLDITDLTQRLPEALVLESEGRSFPVETLHQAARHQESLPLQVLRAIESHGLGLPDGSGILVFLPGLAEINRCRLVLEQTHSLRHWSVQPLHGQLPLEQQRRALRACDKRFDGQIILASAIAESSVTLEGVRLVIDSGLSRQLRYDPNTGMEGLETVPASLASADQRRGRAGRQGPGVCIRLWSPGQQQQRPTFSPPELQLSDPQPVVLELAAWGAGLGEELPWLDPPPHPSLQEGRQQLQTLNALEPDGRLSAHGRQLGQLGVHPRLGVLMLTAQRRGCAELGCDLAALLSDRDPLSNADVGCDLDARLTALKAQKQLAPLRELSRQLQRQLRRLEPPPAGPHNQNLMTTAETSAADLILCAFPEWLAMKRPGSIGRFQLRQGRGARLHDDDPLATAEALAVARLDMGTKETRIQLALALDRNQLLDLAERDGAWDDNLHWDPSSQRIKAERTLRLGALILRRAPQPAPAPERCRNLLIQVLEENGDLNALPWTEASVQLQRRLDFAHRRIGTPWPQRDLEHLHRTSKTWIGAYLEDCLGWRDLDSTTLEEALWGGMAWEQRQQLKQLLPTHLTIPSGRSAALRYETDDQVVLAVKLQEMFGSTDGPRVLHGAWPVTLELLSPAGRPLQRTEDLAGFWSGSYAEVRREMRGRYPKHPWPENPREAIATAATKRRLERPTP